MSPGSADVKWCPARQFTMRASGSRQSSLPDDEAVTCVDVMDWMAWRRAAVKDSSSAATCPHTLSHRPSLNDRSPPDQCPDHKANVTGYGTSNRPNLAGGSRLRLGVQVFGCDEIEHLLVNQVQVGRMVGPGHQPRATGQGVKGVEVR